MLPFSSIHTPRSTEVDNEVVAVFPVKITACDLAHIERVHERPIVVGEGRIRPQPRPLKSEHDLGTGTV